MFLNKIFKRNKTEETEELFGTSLDEAFEQTFKDKFEEQEEKEEQEEQQERYDDFKYKDSDLWTIKDEITTPFSDLWSINSTTNASMINHYDNDKTSIYSDDYISADENSEEITEEDIRYNKDFDILLECYDY